MDFPKVYGKIHENMCLNIHPTNLNKIPHICITIKYTSGYKVDDGRSQFTLSIFYALKCYAINVQFTTYQQFHVVRIIQFQTLWRVQAEAYSMKCEYK